MSDIKTAMILAAGLGTRMRPLTDTKPKPLVKVGGKALIDWVLDDLARAGIETVVINVHYKADLLRAHLADRTLPKIKISDETDQLLDTGGGVAAALPLIDEDVFLVTNSDALWGRGSADAVSPLRHTWSSERMDSLLLLADMSRAHGFDGAGDFDLNEGGTPVRRGDKPSAQTVYGGTQLVHRRVFDNCPAGAFSFNVIWNKALQQGRLKAVLHDDDWYHVGTPDAVEPTAHALTGRALTSSL